MSTNAHPTSTKPITTTPATPVKTTNKVKEMVAKIFTPDAKRAAATPPFPGGGDANKRRAVSMPHVNSTTSVKTAPVEPTTNDTTADRTMSHSTMPAIDLGLPFVATPLAADVTVGGQLVTPTRSARTVSREVSAERHMSAFGYTDSSIELARAAKNYPLTRTTTELVTEDVSRAFERLAWVADEIHELDPEVPAREVYNSILTSLLREGRIPYDHNDPKTPVSSPLSKASVNPSTPVASIPEEQEDEEEH